MKKLLLALTAVVMSLSSSALPTLPATSVDDLVGVYTWNYARYSGNYTTQPDTLASYTTGTATVVINKVDDTKIRITGMFGYPITATVDFSGNYPKFTLSKEDDIYYQSSYGKCRLNAAYYSASADKWYTANVFGYIYLNGYIQLATDAHFYYVIQEGDYAGRILGNKWAPGGKMTPTQAYNGIQTHDYTNSTSQISATYDYPVNISESADHKVTVNGFGGIANVAPVTIDLAADSTFTIPANQSLYTNGDQEYILKGYTTTYIDEITGTGDKTTLTFGMDWTGRSAKYWLGKRSNASIKLLDGEFTYPVASPTSLTLNYTDEDEIMLNPGETLQLEVTAVEPTYASKEVDWTSSDEHLATVDANGLVTAQGSAMAPVGNRAPIAPTGKKLQPVTITATSTVATPAAAPTSVSVQLYVLTDDSTTGVNDLNISQTKSVKYVNAQGIVSDKPFEGMNIQVITLTDGTVKTVKMVK